MKTKTILNIIAFVLAVIGVMFKLMHWPFANIALCLSYLVLFFLLFKFALADNKEAGINQSLNYLLSCTLAIFLLTLMFRSMHWPGGGIFAAISSILALVTTAFVVFSKDWKVSKEFILVLFVFFFAMDALMPNNGWRKLLCSKGSEQKIVTAIAPTKMNVLYIGLDNPVKIAISEIDANRIGVTVDNGTIKGEKGEYIVSPKDVGLAKIVVSANDKAIDSAEFRVKAVPDPVAKVAGIKGSGAIDQAFLLEQKGVVAEMENFDFDLCFKVVEFTVSTVVGKFAVDRSVKSNMFTQEQYDLIRKVQKGKKVYIESIKAVGPDGTIRMLGSIALTIK
jgi:hypothetical protein